jgi:hypothetical protein
LYTHVTESNSQGEIKKVLSIEENGSSNSHSTTITAIAGK